LDVVVGLREFDSPGGVALTERCFECIARILDLGMAWL
jgi:hypothetical protein